MRGNRRPGVTVEDDERFRAEEAVREVYVERHRKLAEAGLPLFVPVGRGEGAKAEPAMST